jgi:uncharacterized membrane protein YkvA (DUF1232 family)
MLPACPACGRPRGSNAECLSCRDAAARELSREAEDVTPSRVAEAAERAGRFVERPPWWARTAPAGVLAKLRLLWLVLRDFVKGEYRVPWKGIGALAAAALYVVSPFDLVPDFLVPLGFTDDALVLALTWGLLKRELLDYCRWKGLSPAHFGLQAKDAPPAGPGQGAP